MCRLCEREKEVQNVSGCRLCDEEKERDRMAVLL